MLDELRAVADFLGRKLDDQASNGGLLKSGLHLFDLTGERPLTFTFSAHGVAVEAELVQDNGVVMLQFDALLGRVPFTARGGHARHAMLAHIKARGGMLVTDGRWVSARSRVTAPTPLNPFSLVATAAAFMMALAPEMAELADYLPPDA
jgi:hypothetical protein